MEIPLVVIGEQFDRQVDLLDGTFVLAHRTGAPRLVYVFPEVDLVRVHGE